jgi:hypothetical protein
VSTDKFRRLEDIEFDKRT